jgi:hypothetical protein
MIREAILHFEETALSILIIRFVGGCKMVLRGRVIQLKGIWDFY